ncbi:plasmid mobilization protein [Streptomyces bluensis]|uniref:Toxin-antitoxin system HicB family antitoxin n=1 Tax=Streptomyces bluensis TaxID=33897 RepID=A0ABW6UU31_9ACTN
MEQKQINVRVDADTHATIEARAKAAGMTVQAYAKQVLEDEGNDLRHRFLGAAGHFAQEWGPHFAERFGHPAPAKTDTRGQAA